MTIDYLRVVLVPASATLVAGNPALPEGYIALDNGGLYGATDWQHHSSDAEIEAGQYKLVFAWFNDDSDGDDTPAAIDNISIQEKGQETGLINGNAGIFNSLHPCQRHHLRCYRTQGRSSKITR